MIASSTTYARAEQGWQDHLDSPLWSPVPAAASGENRLRAVWTKQAARVDFAPVKPHHIQRVAGIYRERQGQPRLMAEV